MAFVGRPHRIDTRKGSSQVRKALESIRMSDYCLAEQKGWMLDCHGLADVIPLEQLDPEIGWQLDALVNAVEKASPP